MMIFRDIGVNMKRYDMAGLWGMGEEPNGRYVLYSDVKITAIMNFNLLDQIRERDARIKELEDVIDDMNPYKEYK